jgi:hypothetical protein
MAAINMSNILLTKNFIPLISDKVSRWFLAAQVGVKRQETILLQK